MTYQYTSTREKKHFVIGIGASAGGLEALHDLFDNMPMDTGCSFIVVQHLSADHKSMLGDLLAKHTLMRVMEAEHDTVLEADHIYVIPSGKLISVKDGLLQLEQKQKNKLPNYAIDVLFSSLAAHNGGYAVGIVLSGTGTDGTRGIEEIKNAGGLVIVQDPGTAAFDGMPNSAVATGLADMILPPELIGEELLEFISEPPLVRSLRLYALKDEALLKEILALLKKQTGNDFFNYKRPTLFRRIAKRMAELSIKSLDKYFLKLQENEEEQKILGKEFLINVTRFFRDSEPFTILRQMAIPQLMNSKAPAELVKVWSVACSTGEEAYSLAILLQDYLQRNPKAAQVKIFATDIDAAALDHASRALYPFSIEKDVPGEFLEKYFQKEDEGYRVISVVRKMVVFANHNILRDAPFSRVDLVSCRNMLIYMDNDLQRKVLNKLYFALNLNGYLLLGNSEHVGLLRPALQEVDRKWKLYKCISKTAVAERETVFSPLDNLSYRSAYTVKQKNPLQHLSECFKETLLEERNMAGIMVDKDLNVKQALGNFRNFLHFPEQQFNLSVLKLVGQDLSIALGIALRKALTNDEPVVMNKVAVHDGNEKKYINVIIRPYLNPQDYTQPYLFLILEEDRQASRITQDVTDQTITSADRIAELEKELNDTRENLQAVIEELESANEEMQSANEEMISTNEELQSTNEELQSLNEELHTVSSEHQDKIKELVELNDDLDNYFRNSDIGQIFIDEEMIIRKFSPGVLRLINLIPSDVGRSIKDITHNIQDEDLVNDVQLVMASGSSIEKEIMLNNDAHYIMRINSYLKRNTKEGAIINFIDVTESRKLTGIIKAVFNISSSGITAKKTIRDEQQNIVDFEYLIVNESYKKLYDLHDEVIGKKMTAVLKEVSNEYLGHCVSVVETGNTAHTETYYKKSDRWIETTIVKMFDGIVSTHTDVTEKKKSQEQLASSFEALQNTSRLLRDSNTQLERSNLDLMQFASVASHDLKEPLRKIQAFGHLLESKLLDKLGKEEAGYLHKMISASGRMQVLIEDVLTLSKLSNSQLPHTPVKLENVILQIIDDLEIVIAEKKAVILTQALPEVLAVKGQMHQLFQNLLSNALKFTDKDLPEIRISGGLADAELLKSVGADSKARFAFIAVKDNGIGFEPEYKEQIFGLFQRLNGRLYDGTGIGLAIAKKIVENHHGFIKAESAIGEGTMFTILLPAT